MRTMVYILFMSVFCDIGVPSLIPSDQMTVQKLDDNNVVYKYCKFAYLSYLQQLN